MKSTSSRDSWLKDILMLKLWKALAVSNKINSSFCGLHEMAAQNFYTLVSINNRGEG
jgi:hypothetical protein